MSSDTVLASLAVSETGFVFDPRSGATYTLTSTGLQILLALREGLSLEQIVGRLELRFDGVTNDAQHDVVEFVEHLRQHGLALGGFSLGGEAERWSGSRSRA
jgi:PqqD family protein of HPr-rel-A system